MMSRIAIGLLFIGILMELLAIFIFLTAEWFLKLPRSNIDMQNTKKRQMD